MTTLHRYAGYLALSGAISFFAANAVAQPYQEPIGKGSMNWGTGEMSAVGMGVSPERYEGSARGRIMAVRAAKIDAMNNLLETMQGVRIEAKTQVKDFAVESAIVRAAMKGVLRGASMVGKPHYMEDGGVEVVMAINYRQSVAQTVLANYGQKKSTAAPAKIAAPTHTSANESDMVTGLVIDAIGKGLISAIAPRILDEGGNIIYSSSMVIGDKANGIVAYDNSAKDAAKLDRVGVNPITIKALKVLDRTDVVISNADAKRIAQAAGIHGALNNARVALAL